MKLERGQKVQAKMFGSYIDAVVIGEPMVLVRFPSGLSQSVRLDHIKVDEPEDSAQAIAGRPEQETPNDSTAIGLYKV